MLQERYQMPQFDRLPIFDPLLVRPGDKLFEQSRVGALRMLRLPAFMTQVLEKIFDKRLHRKPLGDQL
jgi:hypothetical protein